MAKKGVQKWPIFGPPKLTKLGVSQNWGCPKIWPRPLKMTYFGPLFGPLFTTLFVYVLFALQLHAYLGKTWKDAKKVVQKVGFGVSRTSRGLQKLDILSSKCQVFWGPADLGTPEMTHFGSLFGPLFWPLFMFYPNMHAIVEQIIRTQIKWSKRWSKMTQK